MKRMQHASQAGILLDTTELHVVGDVHGQFSALRRLLGQLGWETYGDGGWRHPRGARLLMLGDLIDRGPESRAVVETVRRIVDDGQGLCLMGNHEYNAVQYHSPDPDRPGEHLRPQTEKNRQQHQATLDSYGSDRAGLQEALAWFRSLPVALELPGLRAVHAAWLPRHLGHLDTHEQDTARLWRLRDNQWLAAARPDSADWHVVEELLKGPEVELPAGNVFLDKDGHQRRHARCAWWIEQPQAWQEAVVLGGQDLPEAIATEPFEVSDWHGYQPRERPVLFGHYWRTGEIRFEAPNAACLDYSAGRGETLVAYPANPRRPEPLRENRSLCIKVGEG